MPFPSNPMHYLLAQKNTARVNWTEIQHKNRISSKLQLIANSSLNNAFRMLICTQSPHFSADETGPEGLSHLDKGK